MAAVCVAFLAFFVRAPGVRVRVGVLNGCLSMTFSIEFD
jgi:hypothetical protein